MLVTSIENEFRDLRREKAFEPAGALDLRQLIGDTLFERLVPLGEIGGLGGNST